MLFLRWQIIFFAIVSFDLWMSKGAFDVFALGINFLSSDW